MHQSTTFSQSAGRGTSTAVRRKTTRRSATTLRMALQPSPGPSHKATAGTAKLWPAGNRPSRICTQIERDMAKLFFGGA